jgi:hypothetical protein
MLMTGVVVVLIPFVEILVVQAYELLGVPVG